MKSQIHDDPITKAITKQHDKYIKQISAMDEFDRKYGIKAQSEPVFESDKQAEKPARAKPFFEVDTQ